jgi:hypothetical protein
MSIGGDGTRRYYMSRTLLIACSVILVFVLFCPLIVWSQTISIFVVKGTVTDPEGKLPNNGLAVEVKLVRGEEIIARVNAVIGGISNAYLLSEEIVVDKGEFVVALPPSKGTQAAELGDKIVVQVPDLYDEPFSYTVAESYILSPEYGEMKIRIPYYHFTLSLVGGINLISIPLAEATVEGSDVKIEKVSDLGNLLGDSWNLIITYDSECKPQSYTPTTPPDAKSNAEIDGYSGFIVMMRQAKTLELIGKGWDAGEKVLSDICNTHMVGIPLKDESIEKVSDLGELLSDCWNLIITYDNEGNPQSYTPTTLPEAKSNMVIDGDTGLIVVTKGFCSFSITGAPWSDENRRVSP